MRISCDAFNACGIKTVRANYKHGLHDLNMIFSIKSYGSFRELFEIWPIQIDFFHMFFKCKAMNESFECFILILQQRLVSILLRQEHTGRKERSVEPKSCRLLASLTTASCSAHPLNVAQHLDMIRPCTACVAAVECTTTFANHYISPTALCDCMGVYACPNGAVTGVWIDARTTHSKRTETLVLAPCCSTYSTCAHSDAPLRWWMYTCIQSLLESQISVGFKAVVIHPCLGLHW